MTHAELQDRLDDYVGGELAEDEARLVRRHLDECDDCRDEADALRSLLDQARFLPREIAPPRDLWAGIETRLLPRAVEAPGVLPLRPRRTPRWLLQAAAAVVLVAGSSALTYRLASRPARTALLPPATVTQPATAVPTAFAAFQPAEREYRMAIEDLQRLLAERRSEMSLATAATLEENLRIIDQAIAESRAALERDPASPSLARMLSSVYETKVQVLQQAVQL